MTANEPYYIQSFDLSTGQAIENFYNCTQASKILGIPRQNILGAVKGQRKSVHGLGWRKVPRTGEPKPKTIK